mmetsp:Transcript_1474/g.3199  ORF Transcript_1474/g.3199 Transcript_1474/m.3199 type:complete len:127 (-) Transcript_1474:25-405(-)
MVADMKPALRPPPPFFYSSCYSPQLPFPHSSALCCCLVPGVSCLNEWEQSENFSFKLLSCRNDYHTCQLDQTSSKVHRSSASSLRSSSNLLILCFSFSLAWSISLLSNSSEGSFFLVSSTFFCRLV